MLRRLVRRGNAYFGETWKVIPFQPILFIMLLIGSLHIVLNAGEEIGFSHTFGFWFYYVWVGLSLFAPAQLLCAWYLIRHKTGQQRYRGYWFRLSADIAQFFCVFTFLLAWVDSGRYRGNDYRVYLMFIALAALVFLIGLVVRDLWKLGLIESVASDIRENNGKP